MSNSASEEQKVMKGIWDSPGSDGASSRDKPQVSTMNQRPISQPLHLREWDNINTMTYSNYKPQTVEADPVGITVNVLTMLGTIAIVSSLMYLCF